MKKKELNELRNKNIKELKKIAVEKRLECRKLMVKVTAGKEKNQKVGKNLSREIARILTLVREKEIIEKLQKPEEKKDARGKT
jgi:ribosomal protein L29